MRVHFIAIGGSVMHNLALTLHQKGYIITGSDDEIYNPSRTRLAKAALLPEEMGWNTEKITTDLDAVILGMHARKDNPELARAKELGLPIYSYPAYIYEQSKNKKRIVVAGSHGKTTTTSMIMHVLRYHEVDFDYLVGAQLEGFETMVRLSDAPIIVMEGDEYPSSPIDLRPKIHHYFPHVSILTGIAWDHINVFPTFENYLSQFSQYLDMFEPDGRLIYFEPDEHIQTIIKEKTRNIQLTSYQAFDSEVKDNCTYLFTTSGARVPLRVFGKHNLANLKAAFYACQEAGISEAQFLEAIPSFAGAAKRLQLLKDSPNFTAYLDFAHAPSKVEATVKAMQSQYPDREVIACLELHTFSSLNKKFLPHYTNTMNVAQRGFVFFSEHTLKMKRLPEMSAEEVHEGFNHPNMQVFTDADAFRSTLQSISWKDKVLLLMSSGTFGGTNYKEFVEELKL